MKEGLVRTKRADTEPLSHTLSLSLASFWISRRGSDLSYKSTGQPTANFIYPNKWGSDCDLCFSGAVSSLQEINLPCPPSVLFGVPRPLGIYIHCGTVPASTNPSYPARSSAISKSFGHRRSKWHPSGWAPPE